MPLLLRETVALPLIVYGRVRIAGWSHPGIGVRVAYFPAFSGTCAASIALRSQAEPPNSLNFTFWWLNTFEFSGTRVSPSAEIGFRPAPGARLRGGEVGAFIRAV